MVGSYRAALYSRLMNTAGAADQQYSALAAVASGRDWTTVATFHDRANLLQAAARREFDIVAAPSLDQLGDSLREVVATVQQLRSHGVHLYAHAQSLDTSSHTGPAILSVFTALTECERAHVRERARAGLERARRNGTKIGRPSNMNDGVRAAIIALYQRGLSIRSIARHLRVGNATIYSAIGAATAPIPTEASPDMGNAFRTLHGPLEPVTNGARA